MRVKAVLSILRQIKAGGISMRRRFVLYIGSAMVLVLSLVMLLLNLFGVTLEIPPMDMGIFGSNAAAFISRFTV